MHMAIWWILLFDWEHERWSFWLLGAYKIMDKCIKIILKNQNKNFHVHLDILRFQNNSRKKNILCGLYKEEKLMSPE
jgi:hypothetical protein